MKLYLYYKKKYDSDAMVIRRCPKCGNTNDDQYGFCIKCGYEFPEIDPEANNCPLCGFENPKEAVFCVKCGTSLIFNQNQDQKPIIIKYTNNSTNTNTKIKSDYKPTSKGLIILGYFFSIFFDGIPGLLIGIYIVTRKDPYAKIHGYIQIVISAINLISTLLIVTGIITIPGISQNLTQLYENTSYMKYLK